MRGLEAGGFERASVMPSDIRSIDEFDRTIGMIREEGLKRGKKFYDQEQTEGGVSLLELKIQALNLSLTSFDILQQNKNNLPVLYTN